MKTLVIGLGNPILTDDGVGVWVVDALESKLPKNTPIDITQVSVGGLRLMESMIGYDRVILVDAIQNQNGKPGTIHKMSYGDLQAISPTHHSVSPHDASLVTAIELGREMGLHLPDEIIIFAVEVENVIDFDDKPTPAVAEAIPLTLQAVLNELENNGELAHPDQ